MKIQGSRQQRRAAERAEKKARRHSTTLAGTLATIGAFMAAAPATAATFTVTNLNDAGAGSLRDAVAQANASAGADSVLFQAGLTGTITLTADIAITDPVTISGTGATVSISGDNNSRIFNVDNPASTVPIDVHIDHLTLTQGRDLYGGAILDKDENLVLDQVTITGNAALAGGGVAFYGNNGAALTINQSVITGNMSYYGGGIAIQYASGPVTLTGDQITNNSAYLVGGGMSATLSPGGSVTVTNSTVSGNHAGDPAGPDALGGGIAINGYYAYGALTPVTIKDTTISGNTAMASGGVGEGGGLYIYYVVGAVITQSTISGNQSNEGGGIHFEYAGTSGNPLRIENSTIVNNTASYGGGGIFACSNSYSSITNATVTGNSATNYGGGIDFVDGTISAVTNSIIANNNAPTGPDVNTEVGTTVTANYTLIKTPGAAVLLGGTGNITGVDPVLGPLLPFPGSPTAVERPACGSPVINAGDPAFVAPPPGQDQRHLPRIAGGRVDMGAVEFQPSTIQFTAAAANVNENAGTITLTASRTGGTDGAVSVNYATADGTAKGTASGVGTPDYTPASGMLNWADLDAANKTFSVPIVNDVVFEGPENFTATLSAPSCGVALGVPATETVTIIDGQTQPTLSINNVSQAEGNVGSSNFVFTVTLSGQSSQTVTVNYATANGTATAGSDYTATSGTLTFNPGVTSLPISVPVAGDTSFEGNETFTVTLSTASNATISNPTGTGTITNDDGAVADLSITKAVSSAPPYFATQPINYTITVSNAGPNPGTAVTVTDVLPAGTTLVAATPSQGSCSGTTTVTCNLGTLNNAATATVSLQIRPNNPGVVSNTAAVSAPETDSNPANNSSTVTVTVGAAADIPTLSEKMLMLLAAMFAAIGAWFAGKKS
jgi:uncharacterized repeat protein (TIGR01451 family)